MRPLKMARLQMGYAPMFRVNLAFLHKNAASGGVFSV